jgi:hypothetical protein
MKNSRRGRIIELLGEGRSDKEILSIIDPEFPEGMFATTNAKALAGTKWDLGKTSNKKIKRKVKQISSDPLDRIKLINELRKFEPESVIDNYRNYDLANKSPAEILRFSFGSSIYRAFHHENPTRRYLKWRWHESSNKLIEYLNGLESQEQFDRFALDLGRSIIADWGETNDKGEPTRMNIGYAMKISNLVLKHLSFSLHIQNKQLIEWLHVPWDSYTLAPLSSISHDPRIPKSAGQGYVKNLETYQKLHLLISEIVREASKLKIHYEFFTWDLAHQQHSS